MPSCRNSSRALSGLAITRKYTVAHLARLLVPSAVDVELERVVADVERLGVPSADHGWGLAPFVLTVRHALDPAGGGHLASGPQQPCAAISLRMSMRRAVSASAAAFSSVSASVVACVSSLALSFSSASASLNAASVRWLFSA